MICEPDASFGPRCVDPIPRQIHGEISGAVSDCGGERNRTCPRLVDSNCRRLTVIAELNVRGPRMLKAHRLGMWYSRFANDGP